MKFRHRFLIGLVIVAILDIAGVHLARAGQRLRCVATCCMAMAYGHVQGAQA